MTIHSSFLAWRIPWTESLWGTVHFSSVAQTCLSLVTPWTVARQAPLSMGFSRQEYWSGLPFPPPGDLPDPGIKPRSLMSPALAGGFFTTSATWEALNMYFSRMPLLLF